MQKALLVKSLLISSIIALPVSARCDYPDDLDSIGRRCGGRAASVRPGGYEPPPRETTPFSRNNTYENSHKNTYQVPAPVDTVDTVRANRGELSEWSPVSINGIGGIRVGMTPQQASKETALEMDTESPGGAGCYYIVPTRNYLHGISFMVTGNNTAIDYSSDRIARVDITNSAVRTKSGVSIGDTESDVRRIY